MLNSHLVAYRAHAKVGIRRLLVRMEYPFSLVPLQHTQFLSALLFCIGALLTPGTVKSLGVTPPVSFLFVCALLSFFHL